MPEPPLIAVVGRPNVGKSTLFNRLIGRRKAIVHSESGITRDRLEEDFEWGGRHYRLMDLAGLDEPKDDPIKTEAMVQVEGAVESCDLILMLVDLSEGVTGADQEIAEMIHRSGKPVILAANKLDCKNAIQNLNEFFMLGVGDPLSISALHSQNINELCDLIEESVDGVTRDGPGKEKGIKIVIIGKQNVGKSTLMNSLLGEYRAIVSEIPGTTRDAIDADVTIGDDHFTLIDTAGMKKGSKKLDDVDFYSIRRSQQSIHRADVVLLMLDVQDGITTTDSNIAGIVQASRKAYVILANKWDLTSSDSKKHRAAFARHVEKKLHFMQGAEVLFTSGLEHEGLDEIFSASNRAYKNWNRRLGTSELNSALERYIEQRPPPAYKGRRLKFYFATQPKVAPPTIISFVNAPSSVRKSYVRYLQKKLRAEFDFTGTPVEMYFKKRGKK